MKIIINFILFVLISLMSFGCVGEGVGPTTKGKVNDGVMGRFVREVGPDAIKRLMNDPNAPYPSVDNPNRIGPGLPLDDLLYLIGNINVDKMIKIVNDSGVQKTIDLIQALKGFGIVKGNFDYLKEMSNLVNGVKNVKQLTDVINKVSLDNEVLTDEQNRIYLNKLAYMVVYLEDTSKMISLLNGVIDQRDIVFFIDKFDDSVTLNTPVNYSSVVSESKFSGLANVIEILKKVDGSKIHTLVNGSRIAANSGDDDQRIYINDKLVPLIEHRGFTDPSFDNDLWITKMTTMINSAEKSENIGKFLGQLPVEFEGNNIIDNTIKLLNSCNYTVGGSASSNNSIPTLGYMIGSVDDVTNLVELIKNVSPFNMSSLVNEVSAGSQIDDSGNPDLTAAGQKFYGVINNTQQSDKLHKIMNDISDFSNMATLINSVKISGTARLGILIDGVSNPADLVFILDSISSIEEKMVPFINDLSDVGVVSSALLIDKIDGADNWNNGTPENSTGLGKLINMIENISKPLAMSKLVNGVVDGTKISDLVNQIENSDLLVGLVNTVIDESTSEISYLSAMMNDLSKDDIPKEI